MNTLQKLLLLSATLSLLFLLPAVSSTDELELEHRLSTTEMETPHTCWAKPYIKGPVSVLFFAPSRDTDATREPVEIMQRFDVKGESVYYDTREKAWHGGEKGVTRLSKLLEKNWDVYYLNQVSPEDLPEHLLKRFTDSIVSGRGLVIKNAKGWDKILKGIPLPKPAGIPSGHQCFLCGKGNLVFIPEEESIPYRFGWEVEFDHKMEEHGRSLLWAAGKEPSALIEIIAPETIAQESLKNSPLNIICKNCPSGIQVQVSLRRYDGWTAHLWEGRCEDERRIHLPFLRAGSYFVDATAGGTSGIASWATSKLKVTSKRKVETLTLEKNWGEVGESVKLDVTLSGEKMENEILKVLFSDRFGRILVRDNPVITGNSATLSLNVKEWMPMLLKAEAVLVSGGLEIDSKETYLRVTKRHRGRFHFVVWDYPKGETGPYGVESLTKSGATAILARGIPPLYLSAYNLPFIPYATWLGADFSTLTGSLDKNGTMRATGCYNNKETMQKYIERVVSRQYESRAHGVLAYSLGDECAVRGSCLSQHCLEAYRRYLEEIYGDISSLNNSWTTAYKSFEEITLLDAGNLPGEDAPEWFRKYYEERTETYKKLYPSRQRKSPLDERAIRLGDVNDELSALKEGNYARWYDRQAFQTYNLISVVKKIGEGFRKIDPEALTGFEGTNSFAIPRIPTRIRQGGDIDLIVREFGWWGPYGSLANEVIRSIAPYDFPTGNWIGYFRDETRTVRNYWDVLLSGMNMVQWWRWEGVGQFHGILAPDLGMYPSRRAMLEDTQVVREGLGDWFYHARRIDDKIAVLYSMPSTYICHFDGNEKYSSFSREHSTWINILRDAGLEFRYVTDRMLRMGEFDRKNFRVLLLPFSLALGEKEADAIKQFVYDGGTVIADVRTGIYTDRCKPRERGVLDELFGIERKGKSSPERALISMEGRFKMAGRDALLDPSIGLKGGKALGITGEIPFCVVNRYGKGTTFYLNFPLTVSESPAASMVVEIIAASGVKRGIRIEDTEEPLVNWRDAGQGNTTVKWGPSDDTGYLAFTFFPEKPEAGRPLKAEVTLSNMPERNWEAYDRLCFSINTGGQSPESSIYLNAYCSSKKAHRTVSWVTKTDGWKEYCIDISKLPRNPVSWLRISTYGNRWTGERPFTMFLKDLRLVKNISVEDTAEPEKETVQPYLILPPLREKKLSIKRWRDGENQVVTLQPQVPDVGKLKVILPEKGYVYDIRTKEFLGYTDEFNTAFKKGSFSPNLYAVLTSPVPDVAISTESKGAIRGRSVTVHLSIPGARGMHELKMHLFSPDGKKADWFEKVIIAGPGRKDIFLPIAYNDPAGIWKITSTELFSSKRSEAGFVVSP